MERGILDAAGIDKCKDIVDDVICLHQDWVILIETTEKYVLHTGIV